MDIATLRKACFSIEEIKRLQTAPEEVPSIFINYRQRLNAQTTELQTLSAAVNTIQPEALNSIQDLLCGIRAASTALPLPTIDYTPHFRYIDQEHLFVNRQLGYKMALDDLKTDFQTASGNGVPIASSGPLLLSILKYIAILPLILFILNALSALHWGLRSPEFLQNLLVIFCLITWIAAITFIQNRLRHK